MCFASHITWRFRVSLIIILNDRNIFQCCTCTVAGTFFLVEYKSDDMKDLDDFRSAQLEYSVFFLTNFLSYVYTGNLGISLLERFWAPDQPLAAVLAGVHWRVQVLFLRNHQIDQFLSNSLVPRELPRKTSPFSDVRADIFPSAFRTFPKIVFVLFTHFCTFVVVVFF